MPTRLTAQGLPEHWITGMSYHMSCATMQSEVDSPKPRISVIGNAVSQPMEPACDAACAKLRARLDRDLELCIMGQNQHTDAATPFTTAAVLCYFPPTTRASVCPSSKPRCAARRWSARIGGHCRRWRKHGSVSSSPPQLTSPGLLTQPPLQQHSQHVAVPPIKKRTTKVYWLTRHARLYKTLSGTTPPTRPGKSTAR